MSSTKPGTLVPRPLDATYHCQQQQWHFFLPVFWGDILRGTPHLTSCIVMWLSMLRTYKMHGCPLRLRQSTLFVITWVLKMYRARWTFAAPWYPLANRDVLMFATCGFHDALCVVLQLANNCSAPILPMLCDMTVCCSYLKIVYGYWMHPLPLRHVYGSVCPLFNIWHAYKYRVDHTHSAFLPFMVPLEYEEFL